MESKKERKSFIEESMETITKHNENVAKKESGFFDLAEDCSCNHPEHEPPKYMVIPKGKGYKHVCPGCGEIRIIIPQQTTL